MPKEPRYTSKQIIGNLRETELAFANSCLAAIAAKKIGMSEQPFHCWRNEYGSLRVDQAMSLKDLEKENARLKWLLIAGQPEKALL